MPWGKSQGKIHFSQYAAKKKPKQNPQTNKKPTHTKPRIKQLNYLLQIPLGKKRPYSERFKTFSTNLII